jgi:hypothetical protein
MLAPPIVEATVYLLYSVLAFTTVLVLFASTFALLALAARHVIRKICSLMDAAIDAKSRSTEPYVKILNPLGIAVERRARQIPGGHNEGF